jgi:hypothetical protein
LRTDGLFMPVVTDRWRVIVVGGHTRSVGKTQLVCDLIAALPEARFVAGKITQYGHGVCARNGHDCDCAPDEHVCAISWERGEDSDTDSGRFLAAGARRSFWLRTKQGFLAEGLPLLREALREVESAEDGVVGKAGSRNLILESNALLQFLVPDLYFMVVDPGKGDFKESARGQLDRASAIVLREELAGVDGAVGVPGAWSDVPLKLVMGKPRFLQREGERVPEGLVSLVGTALLEDGVRDEKSIANRAV